MNKIQVIVNYEQAELNKDEIEMLGTLKYSLPMISSYVIEILEQDLPRLAGIKGVVKVEQDAHLTAQMDQARHNIQSGWKYNESNKGKDVTVAVLDTGIFPHNDFTFNGNRIIDFHDFVGNKVDAYDDNGHGTHVAGIIAADGYESKGRYAGIAPLCNIVALKVLAEDGSGNISDVLAGIQWVLDHHEKLGIKVINLSVGMEDIEGEDCTLVKAIDVAWDTGLVVVCAAGNNGPESRTITTPGVSRKVITVGSSDDGEKVHIQGDVVMNYSSRGPTKNCIRKPDIVAPGSNIISCNIKIGSPEKPLRANELAGYVKKSGTSMATPIVAGLMARVLSDYPNSINKDLKLALKYSSLNLNTEWEKQGWGLVNVKKLYEYLEKKGRSSN